MLFRNRIHKMFISPYIYAKVEEQVPVQVCTQVDIQRETITTNVGISYRYWVPVKKKKIIPEKKSLMKIVLSFSIMIMKQYNLKLSTFRKTVFFFCDPLWSQSKHNILRLGRADV